MLRLRLSLRLSRAKGISLAYLDQIVQGVSSSCFVKKLLSPCAAQSCVKLNSAQHPQKLVSFLLKHPSSHEVTQQVYSYVVTSGLFYNCHLHYSTDVYMLLFNNLIRCYSLGRFPIKAITVYKYILNYSLPSSSFDSFTYSFIVHACASLNSVTTGIQVHALTFKVGFQFHVYVQTALTNMYVVCRRLVEALRVFHDMPEKNSVTWNVIITGLSKWGELELAWSLFDQMPTRTVVSWTGLIDAHTCMSQADKAVTLFQKMVANDGIQPTEITLLAIMPALSDLGDLENCQSIHGYGVKRGINVSDIRIMNSLIDTYAKCGCIASASKIFDETSPQLKNLVSWSSIISGCAMHGLGEAAVEKFKMMEKVGLKPNEVTFLSVLNACSHGGLVEEGLKFYEKMVNEYQIAPNIKHYGCLVDMIGRIGRLEEAEKMVLEIPCEIINPVIWRTLLGACSFHGNVEMGERVARKLMEMERRYGGDYVLMSNIFASVGRYKDVENFRRLLVERNAFKVPGHSLV